jgi:DNA transformation protein and related proteins
MAANDELVAHVLELLAPLGQARAIRMFGGRGIYLDDLFIALIAFDRLYLKTDETSRAAFQAVGCEPFSYQSAKGEVTLTSYWSAPADALESTDDMRPWAKLAIDVALRARGKKKVAAKKKAPREKKVVARPPPRT